MALAMNQTNTFKNETGYTILEISITLMIVAILSGLLAPTFSSVMSEHHLRQTSVLLVESAQTARSQSLLLNTPHTISVTNGYISLWQKGSGQDNHFLVFTKKIPSTVRIEFINSTKHKRADESLWHFDSSGMNSAPKLKITQNSSWIELSFHPLSARIKSEDYEFK